MEFTKPIINNSINPVRQFNNLSCARKELKFIIKIQKFMAFIPFML
ncbi:MAG: hypothetical protein KBA11_06855 [Sedimentibacter sp.]|nr:hypothetical protein [Sedimentibacter sp.]